MKSKVIVNVTGKNIDKFIYRLYKNNIDVLNIKYIDYKTIEIEIYLNDYDKLVKLKTIYEVSVKEYRGIKEVKNKVVFNKYILLSLLFGLVLFTLLTNIIYEVNIIYNGSNLRNLLTNELNNYGVKKYSIAKSYVELQNIKNNIIKNNKNKIEWLEIERIGTKYEIRVEPRKINNIEDNNKIYNVVAAKDAIIKSIEAGSGEKVKEINDYVKQGEVVISSNVTLNGEVKNQVSARGRIFGEVWYQTTTEYPLDYYEERETGKKKKVLNLKLINKDYNISPFKHKKKENKVLLKDILLPISLSIQTQKEVQIINDKLSEEEAINKAIIESRNKMMSNLSDNEYIINEKSLKIEVKDSRIVLEMFYTVYEEITQYVEIG